MGNRATWGTFLIQLWALLIAKAIKMARIQSHLYLSFDYHFTFIPGQTGFMMHKQTTRGSVVYLSC